MYAKSYFFTKVDYVQTIPEITNIIAFYMIRFPTIKLFSKGKLKGWLNMVWVYYCKKLFKTAC